MDRSFDPCCECVNSAKWAMRRLLEILRSSQERCNDIQCFPDSRQGSGSESDGDPTYLMLMMWMAIIVVLFFTRPSSLRGPQANKNERNDGGNNGPDVPPIQ